MAAYHNTDMPIILKTCLSLNKLTNEDALCSFFSSAFSFETNSTKECKKVRTSIEHPQITKAVVNSPAASKRSITRLIKNVKIIPPTSETISFFAVNAPIPSCPALFINHVILGELIILETICPASKKKIKQKDFAINEPLNKGTKYTIAKHTSYKNILAKKQGRPVDRELGSELRSFPVRFCVRQQRRFAFSRFPVRDIPFRNDIRNSTAMPAFRMG